jgi:hypothetical protein
MIGERLEFGVPITGQAGEQREVGEGGSGNGASRPADRGRADHALDVARSKRDDACGPGHGKSVACKIRQTKVTKLEASRTQATANVVGQADRNPATSSSW